MRSVTLKEIFGDQKPIIGMVHFWMPSPSFQIAEPSLSLIEFITTVRKDIEAIQKLLEPTPPCLMFNFSSVLLIHSN